MHAIVKYDKLTMLANVKCDKLTMLANIKCDKRKKGCTHCYLSAAFFSVLRLCSTSRVGAWQHSLMVIINLLLVCYLYTNVAYARQNFAFHIMTNLYL